MRDIDVVALVVSGAVGALLMGWWQKHTAARKTKARR